MNDERGMMNGGGRFFQLIVHHSSLKWQSRAGESARKTGKRILRKRQAGFKFFGGSLIGKSKWGRLLFRVLHSQGDAGISQGSKFLLPAFDCLGDCGAAAGARTAACQFQ